MWARLDANDNIVAEYPRPRALRVGDVLYPQTIFGKSESLAELSIYPVRITNANAPDDSTLWTFSESDEFDGTVVLRTRTWFVRPDVVERAQELRGRAKLQGFDVARALVSDKMLELGLAFEADLPVLWKNEMQAKLDTFHADVDLVPDDENAPGEFHRLLGVLGL